MGYDVKTLDPKLQRQIAEAQGLIPKSEERILAEIKGEDPFDRPAAYKGPESQLQRDAEAYLIGRGYWRRSPKMIAAGTPPAGWFIHLHRAEGNPILCDLLVLMKNGQYWECELKKAKGRITAEQKILVESGASLVYSIEEFITKLNEWEERVFKFQ